MKGAAAFNYVMKPAATGAMILEASATELIQFSPLNILNGAAQMETKYVTEIKKNRSITVLQTLFKARNFTLQIKLVPMYIHRQYLTFIEMEKAAVEPIRAEYVHRGSLQYEFGSELLQTPIQLLRISNAEAQVGSLMSRLLMNPTCSPATPTPATLMSQSKLIKISGWNKSSCH